MKKIEVYETFDGKRFDRANDAECYELTVELAKLMIESGYENCSGDSREALERSIELVRKCEKAKVVIDRVVQLQPSDSFFAKIIPQ